MHDVLFGAEGLRSGWGILLFFAFLKAGRYIVYPIAAALFPIPANKTGAVAPRAALVYEGAALLCVLVATWLIARFERRPIEYYGFRLQRGATYYLLAGLASGVALLSLLVAILRGRGLLVFDARLLFGRKHPTLRPSSGSSDFCWSPCWRSRLAAAICSSR